MNIRSDHPGGIDPAVQTTNWLADALQIDAGVAPSTQLWERIERSHRRRRQRRQLLRATSALLVLGCIAGLAWQPWQGQPSSSAQSSPEVAGHALDAAQIAQGARLRQIDRQLDAAYARGDDSAIHALWQRRDYMLQTLEQESNDESTSILAL